MSDPTLGNLLPSVRDAELWNAESRRPFQIAPYEPGDPVTWHVPMADLDRSQYRTWGERWTPF